jgi:hypothetical protein
MMRYFLTSAMVLWLGLGEVSAQSRDVYGQIPNDMPRSNQPIRIDQGMVDSLARMPKAERERSIQRWTGSGSTGQASGRSSANPYGIPQQNSGQAPRQTITEQQSHHPLDAEQNADWRHQEVKPTDRYLRPGEMVEEKSQYTPNYRASAFDSRTWRNDRRYVPFNKDDQLTVDAFDRQVNVPSKYYGQTRRGVGGYIGEHEARRADAVVSPFDQPAGYHQGDAAPVLRSRTERINRFDRSAENVATAVVPYHEDQYRETKRLKQMDQEDLVKKESRSFRAEQDRAAIPYVEAPTDLGAFQQEVYSVESSKRLSKSHATPGRFDAFRDATFSTETERRNLPEKPRYAEDIRRPEYQNPNNQRFVDDGRVRDLGTEQNLRERNLTVKNPYGRADNDPRHLEDPRARRQWQMQHQEVIERMNRNWGAEEAYMNQRQPLSARELRQRELDNLAQERRAKRSLTPLYDINQLPAR